MEVEEEVNHSPLFIQDIRNNKILYFIICIFFIFIILSCLFFTLIGVFQPFSTLIEETSPHHNNISNNTSSNNTSLNNSLSSSLEYSSSLLSDSYSSSSLDIDDSDTKEEFLFIHITDIHGWIAGHDHEDLYNADLGDFASLMEHLLLLDNKQVLLFDSGDITEGTGISDGTTIHGELIFPLIQKIPGFTALTIGNHDLGDENQVNYIKEEFIPFYNDISNNNNGRYLTSNTFYENNESLGNKYSIYTTSQGSKLLIMGFIYDFTKSASNSNIHNITTSTTEDWFINAMSISDIDMIIITAHIDPESSNFNELYNSIRLYQPNIPLIIFSGHRHRLYFNQMDNQGYTLESGRYFEHIGIIELSLQDKNISNFSQKWINTSLDEYYELSNTNTDTFLTDLGREIKDDIQTIIHTLNLDTILGCSPIKYSPYTRYFDEDSLYRLYLDSALPTVLNNISNVNQFFVCNSASLRYDLYPGEISRNDVFTINPFQETLYYLPELNSTEIFTLISEMKSSSKLFKEIDRIPYKNNNQKEITNLGNYYYCSIDIEDNEVYDFICPEYDTINWQEIYNIHFPNSNKIFDIYTTEYDTTSLLIEYFWQDMSCSLDCPCPSILG